MLRRVRRGARFDEAADQSLRHVPPPDRRLAHEIAAGCLRERRQLDRRIHTALTHPNLTLPDDVRDLLRIGVYQIVHLDRIPDHAAVDTAVELTRAIG